MFSKFASLAKSRQRLTGPAQTRPATRGEKGQALVVIAMAMVGLLAFIGLTVDAGILFIGVGHLRRAVDAAALAASAQFREGRTDAQLLASAREVVNMNDVDPYQLELWRCVDRNAPKVQPNDPALCAPVGEPQRKLVKVIATNKVKFAFLTIIGFHDTLIVANATSEAASVDVVLAIDTSDSMASDGDTGLMQDPVNCNADDPTGVDGFPGSCKPFQYVKQAAVDFIGRLYYPYDRVAIVTFDNVATLQLPITNTLTLAAAADVARNLEVSHRRSTDPSCTYATDGDPSGCTNTSIGGGLNISGGEFGRQPIRQESLWVVVLLTDGFANASQQGTGGVVNEFCPPSTWVVPFCHDSSSVTRHTVLNPTIWAAQDPGHVAPYNPNNSYNTSNPYLNYDAEDFARDQADFVGCAAKAGDAQQWCHDALDYIAGTPKGGQGALIFSIGLGKLIIGATQGDRDAGDNLLRYISNVGSDGDPNGANGPDPCVGVAVPILTSGNDSYNCSNYYYAEFGSGLTSVFESISSRIFTRLTQ